MDEQLQKQETPNKIQPHNLNNEIKIIHDFMKVDEKNKNMHAKENGS